MIFTETRGNDGKNPSSVTFSRALLSPSASYGGLYSPKNMPTIDADFLLYAKDLSYKELAKEIFRIFDFDIESEVLDRALARYDSFDSADSAPLSKIEDDLFDIYAKIEKNDSTFTINTFVKAKEYNISLHEQFIKSFKE